MSWSTTAGRLSHDAECPAKRMTLANAFASTFRFRWDNITLLPNAIIENAFALTDLLCSDRS